MEKSVRFLVVLLASLTVIAYSDVCPLFAYGGRGSGGMSDPEGSSEVNISFTNDLNSANRL
ncbi:MAG: hypothetical protein JW725_04885 [Candidatus Babeliaceae bacterium]|nr:hypothetical protein [Candidatus Babeliaceae bacterium]